MNTIALLLSDERIDPMIGLHEMVLQAKKSHIWDSIDVLVLDPRVHVEDLSGETASEIVSELVRYRSGMGDRYHGSILGLKMGEAEYDWSRSGLYSALLKYLIIKRPTASELMDWMTNRREPRFALAARMALDYMNTGESETASAEMTAYQTLMLSALSRRHDTATIYALLTRPDRSDVSVMSGRLIGAFLGEKKLHPPRGVVQHVIR